MLPGTHQDIFERGHFRLDCARWDLIIVCYVCRVEAGTDKQKASQETRLPMAQLEWQWGHVLTVPLPADDRHKVPEEDSVLLCGLCGTPRQVRARKSDKNRVGPFFVGGCRGCYENSENLKWGQGGGTRIQFQEDPKKWRWD